MIELYENGIEFLEENKAYLDTDKYQALFIYLDAPLLKEATKINYALKLQQDNAKLLSIKVEPFNTLFFGDEHLVGQWVDYIVENGYDLKSYLSSTAIGDAVLKALKEKYGIEYYEALAMDFMEAYDVTEPSSNEVEVANEDDLDELIECVGYFIRDCGLQDEINVEKLKQSIGNFRIVRRDGKIASMGKLYGGADGSMKISDVYTRNEYRCQHLARAVVNNLKNEILEKGLIATLNVDRHNPVTNHLYRSLGFKPVFSQGEYRKK